MVVVVGPNRWTPWPATPVSSHLISSYLTSLVQIGSDEMNDVNAVLLAEHGSGPRGSLGHGTLTYDPRTFHIIRA